MTAFPAPHYGTFRRPEGEKPPAGCFGLPIFVVNAKVKGNSYKLEAEAESSVIRWPTHYVQHSVKIKTSSGINQKPRDFISVIAIKE